MIPAKPEHEHYSVGTYGNQPACPEYSVAHIYKYLIFQGDQDCTQR